MRGSRRLRTHDLIDHRRIISIERQPSGDQQIEQHAGGKDVRPAIDGSAPKPFGSHVGWRAHQRSCAGDAGIETGFIAGDAEVKQFDRAIYAHNHVRRFDIAMDDAIAMSVSQGQANLLDHAQRMLQLEAMALNGFVQGFALDVFHDDVRFAILIAGVVHDDDVVVAESAGLACLTVEPLQHFCIAAEALGQHLDGHDAA